jgi:hypothetical protein
MVAMQSFIYHVDNSLGSLPNAPSQMQWASIVFFCCNINGSYIECCLITCYVLSIKPNMKFSLQSHLNVCQYGFTCHRVHKAQSGTSNQQLKAPTSLECFSIGLKLFTSNFWCQEKLWITRYPCPNAWAAIITIQAVELRVICEIKRFCMESNPCLERRKWSLTTLHVDQGTAWHSTEQMSSTVENQNYEFMNYVKPYHK